MYTFLALRIAAFFAGIIFSICANAAAYDWHVLASREMGFRIEYPNSWSITDDGTATKKSFRITAPNFSSCGISKGNETRTMEQFVNGGGFEQMLRKFKKAQLVEKKWTQWALQKALLTVFTWEFESVGHSIDFKTLQIGMVQNGIGWVGTCSAYTTEFEKDRPIFEAILGSVIIP
jgi:hypothetical protein